MPRVDAVLLVVAGRVFVNRTIEALDVGGRVVNFFFDQKNDMESVSLSTGMPT
jgi:hypothetical protein